MWKPEDGTQNELTGFDASLKPNNLSMRKRREVRMNTDSPFEDETPCEALDTAKKILVELESLRESKVDPLDLGYRSKVPFKAMVLAQSLLWRSSELGRGALQAASIDSALSVFILVRSIMETSALMSKLADCTDKATSKKSIKEIDEPIMRILMSNRSGFGDGIYSATNILTVIDKINERMPGVRNRYDDLSEVAHPNWQGTLGLFSSANSESVLSQFGRYIGADQHIFHQSYRDIGMGLTHFLLEFSRFIDCFESFGEKCESFMNVQEGEGS